EIDDVSGSWPPPPTDIKPEISQLSVASVEHDTRGSMATIRFPLDVARRAPVVAPRCPAPAIRVRDRVAAAADLRPRRERHAYRAVRDTRHSAGDTLRGCGFHPTGQSCEDDGCRPRERCDSECFHLLIRSMRNCCTRGSRD